MEQRNIIVAIDGYSACGKSTVAKALAREKEFTYIDSGAMYRAVTLYFLDNDVALDDAHHIQESLDKIQIDFTRENEKDIVLLNQEDVSDKIREMRTSQLVPSVSAIEEVRNKLTLLQREMGKSRSIVMDGRDIGSVVFPHAQLKIFMTADPKVRATRRLKELVLKNPNVTLEEVLISLEQRDYQDINRKISPLIQAPGSLVLDNSMMTPDEQLNFLINKMNELQ